MKEETKSRGGGRCDCGCCNYSQSQFFLRWLLGLIILSMVFVLGITIGELKNSIEGPDDIYNYRSWSLTPGRMMVGEYDRYYAAPAVVPSPATQVTAPTATAPKAQ